MKVELLSSQEKISSSSCYRTGGSVPVPVQAKEKVRRRIKLHRYKDECLEELSLETCQQLKCDRNIFETVTTELIRADDQCQDTCVPLLLDLRTCSPPEPPQQPPQQPQKPPGQKCKKHTRCHCDLLSLEHQTSSQCLQIKHFFSNKL